MIARLMARRLRGPVLFFIGVGVWVYTSWNTAAYLERHPSIDLHCASAVCYLVDEATALFLLMAGMWSYLQYTLASRNGVEPLLAWRPHSTWRATLCEYAAGLATVLFVYAFVMIGSFEVVRFIKGGSSAAGFPLLLNSFLRVTLLAIAGWEALALLLSRVSDDARLFVPVYLTAWLMTMSGGRVNLIVPSVEALASPRQAVLARNGLWLGAIGGAWLCAVALGEARRRGWTGIKVRHIQLKLGRQPRGPVNSPTIASALYAFRVNVGWLALPGMIAAALLAAFLGLPQGPIATARSSAAGSFLGIAFAETMLPPFIFLVAAQIFVFGPARHIREILASLPGARSRVLKEKAWALLAYSSLVVGAFAASGVFISPLLPIAGILGVAVPSALYLTSLALLGSQLPGRRVAGHALPLFTWLAALLLKRVFPLWLHPSYHSAQFAAVSGMDLLAAQKTVITLLAVAISFCAFRLAARANRERGQGGQISEYGGLDGVGQ